MSYNELRNALDIINISDYPKDFLIISWSLLRYSIYKIFPKADYIDIKRELDYENADDNMGRSYLNIDWDDFERIIKVWMVVQ